MSEKLPTEAMIRAGETAWHEWERGNEGSTLGELVQFIWCAMQAARPTDAVERVNEIIADKLCPIFGPGPYETLAADIVTALTDTTKDAAHD